MNKHIGNEVTEKGVGALLAKIDTDRDGTVSLDEFIAFFGQVAATEEFMDALEEFKTAGSRRTYVIAISTFLGPLPAAEIRLRSEGQR